eukprot:751456-Hanusia_phi.AAC.2
MLSTRSGGAAAAAAAAAAMVLFMVFMVKETESKKVIECCRCLVLDVLTVKDRGSDEKGSAMNVGLNLACLLTTLHLTSLLSKVFKKKILMQGKKYKIHADTESDMCNAVISEMHTELVKHKMKADGEDNIYDTAGMAICLGVVQRYTFDKDDTGIWKLIKKNKTDDDDEDDMFGGMGEGANSQQVVEGLLLTKRVCDPCTPRISLRSSTQVCMDWCEELQQEVSEVMYKRVDSSTPQEIAQDFCPQAIKPEEVCFLACKLGMTGSSRQKRKGKVPYTPKTAAAAPPSNPSDMMQGTISPGTLLDCSDFVFKTSLTSETRLARSVRVGTLAWFTRDLLCFKEKVNKGRIDLQCSVCKLGVKKAIERVKEMKSTTPQFKDRWQREALVTDIVQKICHGKDYDRQGYYPAVPGNPPEWAQSYHIYQDDPAGPWKLSRQDKRKNDQHAGSEDGAGSDKSR